MSFLLLFSLDPPAQKTEQKQRERERERESVKRKLKKENIPYYYLVVSMFFSVIPIITPNRIHYSSPLRIGMGNKGPRAAYSAPKLLGDIAV